MPHRQPAPSRARRQNTNPKRRWTAAEKAQRSAKAQRSDRAGWNSERTERNDRPQRSDRERTTWTDRSERGDRERSTWTDRSERGDRERSTWNDRSQRSDRERSTWSERPRSERPSSERAGWSDRPERAGRSGRDDRSSRSDRPQRDRPQHSEPAQRSDRPQQSDRPRRSDSAPRGERFQRDDRPWRSERPAARRPHPVAPESAAEPTVQPATPAPVAAPVAFSELGLPQPMVAALAESGITTTFAIQSATIPDALAGRDVLGRGQTGSGKTLAFGLPMLARLADPATKDRRPRGVVLLPTRELAMQVHDALAPLARAVGLSLSLVAGGMSYTPQLKSFERGVDVVIATPGRLLDLMERGAADLRAVQVTVLDEADHMADLGFLPAVTTVLDTVPAAGQRLLFSATLDNAIGQLVRSYLTDPVTHEVDSGRASVTTMEHRLIHIQPKDKQSLTSEIAGRDGRTVIFVRTQLGAERVAEQLRDSGVLAGALHGGLTQSIRTRILAAFKAGELPVLVATDVAARGIHVDEVGLVLQVDPPAGPKEYLHRAGRTARAGGTGVVVTLVLPQQRREVTRLAAQAGVSSAPMVVRPGDYELAAVTGAKAPSGVAISRADYDKVIAPRPTRRPRAEHAGRSGRARRGDGPGRDRKGRRSSGPRP
ncbi:DEAD/DEAH box helicase [Microlunatus ginsengisoli]|uniref:Superfamily II DNA and RNA helicase n=1 Tax=Microlunatus ginsengisoli TaxID=363863 RepID=A0ABP6ZVV4_9ACTN